MTEHQTRFDEASDEIWMDIDDYDGIYQVSNRGRVKSLARTIHHPLKGDVNLKERILKIGLSRYANATLSKDGIAKCFSVHRLVAIAFLGQPEESDMQICHYDGNPANNNLNNLRWDTPKNNHLDRVRHGTILTGERNPRYGKPPSEKCMAILKNRFGKNNPMYGRRKNKSHSVVVAEGIK